VAALRFAPDERGAREARHGVQRLQLLHAYAAAGRVPDRLQTKKDRRMRRWQLRARRRCVPSSKKGVTEQELAPPSRTSSAVSRCGIDSNKKILDYLA